MGGTDGGSRSQPEGVGQCIMCRMMPNYPLKAIVWDFDGTLADTRKRNLNVNRRIVQELTGRDWQEVAALSSVEAYLAAWNRVDNWHELYTTAFGLDSGQLEAAGQRWAPYQIADETQVPLFPGIRDTLHRLPKVATAAALGSPGSPTT